MMASLPYSYKEKSNCLIFVFIYQNLEKLFKIKIKKKSNKI